MSLFKFAESRDAQYIEELKNSSLPVYVYGNGIMSDYIQKKLSRNKISIRSFVIDDQYFNDQKNCIRKSELERLGQSYNLVIAIEKLNDKSPDEIRSNFSNCRGVYQFTSVLEEFGIVEPITKKFYDKHSERIDAVYYSLYDDFSKRSFDMHIHARIEENVSRLKSYVIKPQYFFKNEYWQFRDNEVLIDGGAFDGDTISDFIDEMSIRGGVESILIRAGS